MGKNLTLDQIKEAELEVLIEVDRICGLLNIDYYLAYGTLLGAVRHKGFIPWDDDIDVWIRRADLELLIEKFNSLCDPQFKLIYYTNDENYLYAFPKVCNLKTEVEEICFKRTKNLGVWVDLFFLDPVQEDHKEEDAHLTHLQHVRWMNLWSQSVWWKKLNLLWGNLTMKDTQFSDFSNTPKAVMMEMNEILCKNKESGYLRSASLLTDMPKIMKAEWFEKTVLLDFEGHRLKAPKEYKKILEVLYGDYMKLPPLIEQKFQNHFRSSRYKD